MFTSAQSRYLFVAVFLHALASSTLLRASADTSAAPAELLPAMSRSERQLLIDQKYLLVPINNDSRSRRVRLVKDGKVLRSFSASLGLPAHWWAHLDVSNWESETITLSVELDTGIPPTYQATPQGRGAGETSNAELAAGIHTSPDIWSPESVYNEPLRPQIHFSARRGWNNDLNGLVHYNGEYHMFFQHNPYGLRWGNAHWGHATSEDLVHWRELPIALYPRGDDDNPYSGSAVVDFMNTSGWGEGGRAPLVIAFSSTGRGECIAYSNDGGATWTEYEGNPVLQHHGRDPRLLWHAKTEQWVMAVFSETRIEPAAPTRQGIAFYTSPDLKAWRQRSWIEGFVDCPDLFELPADGDPTRMKWVLSGGSGNYQIGEFDGARFVPEGSQLLGPVGGSSLYAAQTFSNHPDGELVQFAWGGIDTVGAPFTQLVSFPVKLSLRTTSEGLRLCREPVDAIRSLRAGSNDVPAVPLSSASPLLRGLIGQAWDIQALLKVANDSPVTLTVGGDEYVYQPNSQTLTGPNGKMPIPLIDGRLRIRLLVDRTTVEVFGDLGQAYGMFPRMDPGGNAALDLRASEGQIEKLTAHSLRSAWGSE